MRLTKFKRRNWIYSVSVSNFPTRWAARALPSPLCVTVPHARHRLSRKRKEQEDLALRGPSAKWSLTNENSW